MVERLCAELNVPHRTLGIEVSSGGNLQAEARKARYAALAGWLTERGLDALATAHHADDQAETLLMRLNRGSGVSGLAGVRAVGCLPESDVCLLRPLLSWRKAELEAICRSASLRPARDPSNADERYDRARIRAALEAADWLDREAVARSAAHVADADEALEWAARREWDEQVRVETRALRYLPRAPRAVRLRVVERVLTELGQRPRGGEAARLLDRLEACERGNLGGVLATVDGGEWVFHPEPPRRTG